MKDDDPDLGSRRPPKLRALFKGTRLRDVPRTVRALQGVGQFIDAMALEISADEDTPEGCPGMDKRAFALLNLAYELASDPTVDDETAVADVLRRAGRHRESLRDAEINARSEGRFHDFWVDRRAQGMLRSAMTGEAMAMPTEQDLERMKRVEPFAELEDETQWSHLVDAVPELLDLLRGVSDGSAIDSDNEYGRITATRTAVRAQVRQLLGPSSGRSDPLLASTYARNFASDYILIRAFHHKRRGNP